MELGVDTERRIRILVIRLSSIGDIIQCSGVARHLRTRYPNAHIDWVIRSDNAELLQNNPYVTQIIAFDRSSGLKGWLKLCFKLSKDGYSHIYDAHNNWRSHILCLILQPHLLIRRSKERFKRFLLHVFKTDLYGKSFRTSDSYLKPLEAWGIQNDKKGSDLFLSDETYEASIEVFAAADRSQKWIAMAPATAWQKKTWPKEYWKRLIEILLKETKFQIVILGGPKDDFCSKLVIDPNRVVSLQGRLSLLESAASIKNCELLIAGDTGLLHMAEAVGKDVIGILGPTWFGHPQRPKSVGLQTNLWCQPCSKDGSGICYNPTFQKCMKLITPEGVFNSFKFFLSARE